MSLLCHAMQCTVIATLQCNCVASWWKFLMNTVPCSCLAAGQSSVRMRPRPDHSLKGSHFETLEGGGRTLCPAVNFCRSSKLCDGRRIPSSGCGRKPASWGHRLRRAPALTCCTLAIESSCSQAHKVVCAAGSRDTTVKLWDPATCQCIQTLEGHKYQVHFMHRTDRQ